MSRPFPEPLPEGETNRVQKFYQSRHGEGEMLLPELLATDSQPKLMDEVLAQELTAVYQLLIKNPLRRDYARRIAEIYYTIGELENCLIWLAYCRQIWPYQDPEVLRLIQAVKKELEKQ